MPRRGVEVGPPLYTGLPQYLSIAMYLEMEPFKISKLKGSLVCALTQ